MSPLSRRDFLKVSGVGLGALAFNPFIKPGEANLLPFLDGDSYEMTPVIPKLVDHNSPLPRHHLLDKAIANNILQIPHPLMINGHSLNPEESPIQAKWSAIAKKRLLPRAQISQHVMRTSPKHSIDAAKVPELLSAAHLHSRVAQVEHILLNSGYCTQEQVFPGIVLESQDYSEDTKRLYHRVAESKLMYLRALDLIKLLRREKLDPSKSSEGNREQNDRIDNLWLWTRDYFNNYYLPAEDQFMIETCTPHGIFRSDVWPELPHGDLEALPKVGCYEFVATVVNALAVCRGRSDLSPVKLVDGRFKMKETYRNGDGIELNNFFDAMTKDGSRFNFSEITGSSYAQMMEEVKAGRIIIGVEVEGDGDIARHMYILWGSHPDNNSELELLWAETSAQPNSDLYLVVSEKENGDQLGYNIFPSSNRMNFNTSKRFFTFDA